MVKKLVVLVFLISLILVTGVFSNTIGMRIPYFNDAILRIFDNIDPTKRIAFQASGISTETTRTITMPDADVDLGNIGAGGGAASEAELESDLVDVTNVFTNNDGALDDDDVSAGDVGVASPNLDDTDASVEWEDAADLDVSGEVINDSHTHDTQYYTETEENTWRNSTTQTEMGYVAGVTSDVQTQLNAKEGTLTKGNLTASSPIALDQTRQVIGGAAVISISDAAADGTTKGAAAFNSTRFSAVSGIVDIASVSGITGADEDDVSDDDVGGLQNVSEADVATNDVLKYNGTSWVCAAYNDDLSFSIAAFSDNESTIQLIGSGVWESSGSITFDATYNNGPPSAATITISSDDGGYGVWGTNPLVMDSPYDTKNTTEDTDYPASRGQYVRFTLGTTPADSDTETVTFQNYIWYGDEVKADTYTEADIEAETSTLSSDHTRSVSINAGAGEYLVFSYPTTYTQIPVGADYEDDGGGTGFVFNNITCACALDNAALSITNSAGYNENYDVIVSTVANLGNHTLTTYTSRTAINTIYWGYHTDTSATEATIEGLSGGSSAASNDNTREFTVTAGENQYIYFAYPKRLGEVTFWVGGFEGGFESVDTDSVTNVNGWTEDYYSYRSTNANLGETTVTTQ